MSFRSGFVTLLGRPNTGKSTLLNALVGAKLAIVSRQPQTTRTRLQGILTREHAQLVFVDTPGTHEGPTRLNRRMMKTVQEALEGIDAVLLVVDASRAPNDEDDLALELARSSGRPVVLALNKIDLIDKPALLPLIARYQQRHDFRDYLPVSALRGENLPLLERALVAQLPEGPSLFPPDALTDQPVRFLAAEIIREKILHETRQEVPHAVAVVIEKFEEPAAQGDGAGPAARGLTRILATILVEKDSQKGIIIGAGGQRLKKIGQAARKEIESLQGGKVFLVLYVKTRPDWRELPAVEQLIDWRHASEP